MNGFSALSTSRVEVVVHTAGVASIVAGIVGGIVVLIGVVLTEALVRSRERRRRLEEAMWNLQGGLHGGLLTGHVGHMSGTELSARYAAFTDQLGRIRADARWPMRNAQEIVAEVDAITVRLMVAMGRWGTKKVGPPRLGPILGDRLAGLVFGKRESARQHLDEALSAEGLPSLDEVTADESENAPPEP
jgi:hypothetical protein